MAQAVDAGAISHHARAWHRTAGKLRAQFRETPGTFVCAGCEQPLFESKRKFESGTGWPSFNDPVPGSVETTEDRSYGMLRTEVNCSRCGSHLGHVFPRRPAADRPALLHQWRGDEFPAPVREEVCLDRGLVGRRLLPAALDDVVTDFNRQVTCGIPGFAPIVSRDRPPVMRGPRQAMLRRVCFYILPVFLALAFYLGTPASGFAGQSASAAPQSGAALPLFGARKSQRRRSRRDRQPSRGPGRRISRRHHPNHHYCQLAGRHIRGAVRSPDLCGRCQPSAVRRPATSSPDCLSQVASRSLARTALACA